MDVNCGLYVPTDDDEEEGGEEKMPSCTDYVLHFLTVFWKILFAFVPPTGEITPTVFNNFLTLTYKCLASD